MKVLHLLCTSCLLWQSLAVPLDFKGNDPTFTLTECQGDCDKDSDCLTGLKCFQRDDLRIVPGCTGQGAYAIDYCYNPAKVVPTPAPGPVLIPGRPVTYFPGKLKVDANGLNISEGLVARIIARSFEPVQYAFGGSSAETFIGRPDGADCFYNSETEGWAYLVNSEEQLYYYPKTGFGGVGAIYFDKNGNILNYKQVLKRTNRNCSGGRTWWDTWLTCEEVDDGQIWEVDPWEKIPNRRTMVGAIGGFRMGGTTMMPFSKGQRYEAVAYDRRDVNNPRFYATVDQGDGPLTRFTPSSRAVMKGNDSGSRLDFSKIVDDRSNFVHEYWLPDFRTNTYTWTTDLAAGQEAAAANFPNCEGISRFGKYLYVTCKENKNLFILDLDSNTFTGESTVHGTFQDQPDQVQRTFGNVDKSLYFAEDGNVLFRICCGIHVREDQTGKYYTIVESASEELTGETSGMAFSPDNMFFYFSFNAIGVVVELRREDGYPFGAPVAGIVYSS